jgi:ATP-binding cassette, subfamily B, multidrug efflux pump
VLSWFESRIDPYPDNARRQFSGKLLPFLWECTEGLRSYLLAMTILSGMSGAFEALLFFMLGRLIDWMNGNNSDEFLAAHGGSLFILAGILVLSPLIIALGAGIKYQVIHSALPMRLRWIFHGRMLTQSLSFFHDEFSGRVASKIMQTVVAVRDTWVTISDILVYVVVYLITAAAVVAGFDYWLLVPFLGWIFTYGLAMVYFVPRIGKVAAEQADARSLMMGRIADAYTNISTVKLFAHASREARYARSVMNDFIMAARKQNRYVSGFEILNHCLNMLLILATAAIAVRMWLHGTVQLGAVAAATAMALRLNGVSQWIIWELAGLFENVGTVRDGMDTVTRPIEVHDRLDAVPLCVTRGEILFEHVKFRYGTSKFVIDDLTLTIGAGEKIGLVGRSGAGKSTLVNLLLRFYQVQSGRILIDDQDIALVTQESVCEQIGMVTQDTSLLHRSVRDNIIYGRPQASNAEVQAAARRAHAAEFIESLQDSFGGRGYDVLVGERGVKLSGGQRQRIAIARVMLKDAPILVLDEATSALDSEVEAAIQQTLETIMRGKTVVAIAHRLSTIAAMDRLIVLDAGVIVESGTHSSLLDSGGIYARLWRHQSGGFLGRDDDIDEPGMRAIL